MLNHARLPSWNGTFNVGRAPRIYAACLAYFTIALVAVSPALGQPEIPVTPAEQVFAAWLEAFNSGDKNRLDNYYRTYDEARRSEGDLTYRQITGGFDVVSVEVRSTERIDFVVGHRSSEYKSYGHLSVTTASPVQVSSFYIVFLPSGSVPSDFAIDPATRAKVIEDVATRVNGGYVFEEIGKQMAVNLRELYRAGVYKEITDGTELAASITADMRKVRSDKHLALQFSSGRLPEDWEASAEAQYARTLLETNCGFERAERLPGNIGYLKLNVFGRPSPCATTATAAMMFLEHVDALIFDLRANYGGDPMMVSLLATYLFAEPTRLSDIWRRRDNASQQYWTLPFVSGGRLDKVPVYVLTSSQTFSAAEQFAFDLQKLRRVTVVGETTAGGAHPVEVQRLDEHFTLTVPVARAINPVTSGDWEETGVEPDVRVLAADALSTAQKLATERLGRK